MRTWLGILLVFGVVFVSSPAPQTAFGGEEAAAEGEEAGLIDITSADDIDLLALMKWAGAYTDKNFLYDPTMKRKKVSVHFPNNIPQTSVFKVFLSVLEMNKYGIVDYGEFCKIVQLTDAKTSRMDIVTPDDASKLPVEDRLVTVLLPLEHADPMKVQPVIQAMINTRIGTVRGLADTSFILITEMAANLPNIIKIVRLVDQKADEPSIVVIRLQHAAVDEISSKLTSLVQAKTRGSARKRRGAQAQQAVQIVPYPPTNSLIVLGFPDAIEEVREVVKILDQEVLGEVTEIRLYQLENTEAKTLAGVLDQVYTKGQSRKKTLRGKVQVLESPPPSIVAEENTNSLIVIAGSNEFDELDAIIETLDVRKPQVFIEAAIVEIRGSEDFNLGVELLMFEQPKEGRNRGFGWTSSGLSTLAFTGGETPEGDPTIQGRIPNTGGSGLVLGMTRGVSKIPFLLAALQKDRQFELLEQPMLLTNDNEKATFKSTNQVPTTTFTTTTTSTDTRSFGGFQEAGVTLEITPHISKDNYLTLEIQQKIEKFTGASEDPSVPPPKISREVQATVTVPDRRTVVIGGLTTDNQDEAIGGVPLLKDIPFLGKLFQSRSTSKEKSTVYLFITPHILADDDFAGLMDYTAEKKRRITESGSKAFAEDDDAELAITDKSRDEDSD